nr:DAP3-binding cell death enhancer 1 [Ciona intestinalis]|eukprot:XP_009862077.1 DAP3-binding cell death enhancer 1 [Ciona intestinalis]
MSRIWNCLTRGFRVRPAPNPTQASQRKDDNEAISSTSDEHSHVSTLNKTSWLILKDCGKVDRGIFGGERRNWKQHENDILFRIWDNLAWGTTALIVGRIISSKVLGWKSKQEKRFSSSVDHGTVKQMVRSKHNHDTLQQPSVIKDIFSKVSTSNFPRQRSHIANAAGCEDKGKQPVLVVRTTGGSHFEDFVTNEHTHSNQKCVHFETKGTERKTPPSDQIVSEEDLEEFVQSTQHAVGMSYNVQGLNHVKAGEYKAALKCFEQGSEEGLSKAQFNLALCHQLGKGTKVDMDKAVHYYKRAALQEHESAQYNLALILLEEDNKVKVAHGLHLLEKVALKGNVQAQSYLGSFLAQPGVHCNRKKAVHMFQMAANSGDALSTYHLAECYEHGLGDLKVNSSQAFQLYATAAQLGNTDAHFKMACMLYNGCEGVERNTQLAEEMLQETASKGHRLSALKLWEIKLERRRENEKKKLALLLADFRPYDSLSTLIVPEYKQPMRRNSHKFNNTTVSDTDGAPNTFHRVASCPTTLLHNIAKR